MGVLAGCNDLLIENNTFDNNGVGMFDHHIYLGGLSVQGVYLTAKQVVVRGNTLTNNTPYASSTAVAPTPGLCGAVAIVAHGLYNGLIIEDNTVIEPKVPASGSCWGISVDSGGYGHAEGFTNVSIRGNTVINYAVGIGMDLCNGCVIENNYVYSERAASSGVVVPSKYFEAPIPGNTVNNDLTVRNNTIYLKSPTYASVGLRLSRDGKTHTVASNLIYFGAGATTGTACFNASGLPTSAFSAFDYNLCYFSATVGAWDTTRTTLAAQRSAGLDTHSQSANPLMTLPVAPNYSTSTGTGSPAIKAGHPTASSKFSLDGLRRDSAADIGASQQGAVVVVPSTPTSMSIQ